MLGNLPLTLKEKISESLTTKEVHSAARVSHDFHRVAENFTRNNYSCNDRNVDGSEYYYFDHVWPCPRYAEEKTLDSHQRGCAFHIGLDWETFLEEADLSPENIERVLSICNNNTNAFGLVCLILEHVDSDDFEEVILPPMASATDVHGLIEWLKDVLFVVEQGPGAHGSKIAPQDIVLAIKIMPEVDFGTIMRFYSDDCSMEDIDAIIRPVLAAIRPNEVHWLSTLMENDVEVGDLPAVPFIVPCISLETTLLLIQQDLSLAQIADAVAPVRTALLETNIADADLASLPRFWTFLPPGKILPFIQKGLTLLDIVCNIVPVLIRIGIDELDFVLTLMENIRDVDDLWHLPFILPVLSRDQIWQLIKRDQDVTLWEIHYTLLPLLSMLEFDLVLRKLETGEHVSSLRIFHLFSKEEFDSFVLPIYLVTRIDDLVYLLDTGVELANLRHCPSRVDFERYIVPVLPILGQESIFESLRNGVSLNSILRIGSDLQASNRRKRKASEARTELK